MIQPDLVLGRSNRLFYYSSVGHSHPSAVRPSPRFHSVVRTLSAPEDLLPTHRTGEKARASPRHLLGPPGARLRRSECAASHRQSGARGARSQSHRSGVHRRWIRRLPDVGAPSHRLCNIATSRHPDDGLQLTDAYILAAVRCAPPGNKPLPEEITRCLDHLDAELTQLPRIRVVVALGKIGFDAWLQRLRRRGVVFSPRPQFGHGVVVHRREHKDRVPALVGYYHPSRQNTNTGKLTATMMEGVFRKARRLLDK